MEVKKVALSRAIVKIAERKKLSFYRVSKNGKIAQTTLSEIINDNNQNPTIDTLSKIAKGLGVTVSELIKEAEKKEEQ